MKEKTKRHEISYELIRYGMKQKYHKHNMLEKDSHTKTTRVCIREVGFESYT